MPCIILSKATDFVKWTGADEGLHGVPFPDWMNPNTHRLTFYFITLGFLVVMYPGHAPDRQFTHRPGFGGHPG